MTDILRATTEGYLAGLAVGKAEAAKYRRGNTELIECLMDMVNQFFHTRSDDTLSHSFMSAEENAIETLINAGFAEELEGCTYRLLWDKLEERIQSEIRTHPQAQVPEQRPGPTHVADPAPGLQGPEPDVSTAGRYRGLHQHVPANVDGVAAMSAVSVDTRHLRGMQLSGLNIVVSSWLSPVPAVSLSHDFTAASAECIADMSAWLLKQFGTREQVFLMDGKTLVVSHKTFQLLREMT